MEAMRYRAALFVRGRRVKSTPSVDNLQTARAMVAGYAARYPRSKSVLEVYLNNEWEPYE